MSLAASLFTAALRYRATLSPAVRPVHPQPFLLPRNIWLKTQSLNLAHQVPPASALRASVTGLFSQRFVTFSFCTHIVSPSHPTPLFPLGECFESYLKGYRIWESFIRCWEGSCFSSSRFPDTAHSYVATVSPSSSLSHHGYVSLSLCPEPS